MITVLYIILAILIFGFLIFIHELGHFLAARACKVTVHEFSIGMGPKIVSFCPGRKKAEKKKKREAEDSAEQENEFTVDPRPPKPITSEGSEADTEAEDENGNEPIYTAYSLRALPFGGYVSMEGENEDSNDPNALSNKNVWQRMFIMIAGPAMNLILGFVLMFIMVCGASKLASTVIVYDHSGENAETVYTSEATGLKSDDKIIKIGKVSVHTGNEVAYEIMYQGHQPIDIVVERNGERIVLENVSFPTVEENGTTLGLYDFRFYATTDSRVGLWERITTTFWRSCSTVKMVWDSLGGLFSGRFGVESVSGPVGVTEVIVEAAQASWDQLLYIVTVITINLGVMNLLPIPALDGGQLLVCVVELIIRRPISEKVKGYINFAGLAVLMLFMVVIAAKDIISLAFRFFGG